MGVQVVEVHGQPAGILLVVSTRALGGRHKDLQRQIGMRRLLTINCLCCAQAWGRQRPFWVDLQKVSHKTVFLCSG
jgi:hypothetical protein